jgi:hypothetical protein
MASLRPLAAASAAVLILSGCATFRAADKRASDLSTYFAEHPFDRACDGLWPAALKVAAARGFPLSSKDRQLVGESSEGVMTQLISAATQTYRTAEGGLVSATDWNPGSGTRLRITATPAGPAACRVRYDVVAGGVTTADEQELGPDWNYDLDLLQVLDPAKAAALAASLP